VGCITGFSGGLRNDSKQKNFQEIECRGLPSSSSGTGFQDNTARRSSAFRYSITCLEENVVRFLVIGVGWYFQEGQVVDVDPALLPVYEIAPAAEQLTVE